MKENSIEEDIKKVENYLENSAINDTNSNFFKNGGWETVDLEIPKAMQHILADYKRVLKENKELENNTRKNEQNSLEFDVDGDWAELKRILNESRKTNEYITYKGEKWIKEKYCIPIQKVKDIIKKLNIDIERNKRRKIQHNEDGSLQIEMIAYDPAIIKMRLLKLLESEE